MAESGEALLLAPGVLLHVVVQLVQLGAADLGLRYFKYYLAMLRRNDVAKIYSKIFVKIMYVHWARASCDCRYENQNISI